MTPEWFVWYGLHLGLTLTETLDIPLGELHTLINIELIKVEGAKMQTVTDDEAAIPDIE